jgi:WD40 repeat protein
VQTFQFAEHAYAGYPDKIAFSPDGRFLAASGGAVTLLDTTGERPPADLDLGYYPSAFAFVRGGRAIAYLEYMHEFKVYDLKSGRTRTRPVEGGHAIDLVADGTGRTLYLCHQSAGCTTNSCVQVVAASDLKRRATFGRLKGEYFRNVVVSADSRRLATASWTSAEPSSIQVRVWRIDGPKLPARPAVRVEVPHPLHSLALSHDGARLATASRTAVSQWDTTTGKRVAHSGAHKRVLTAVAFSPTRPVLVSADKAGNVFLWDAPGKVLKRYDWGLQWVRALAFAPDGLRCAAVDETGKVVIWDVDE